MPNPIKITPLNASNLHAGDLVYNTNTDTMCVADNKGNLMEIVSSKDNNKVILIDPSEVEELCKKYPALAKPWREFLTIYALVKPPTPHDDWDDLF